MNGELLIVLVLLAVAVTLFMLGKPRMDVVAVIMMVMLPVTGILTVDETLAGFSDPNVVLIAALFVVGEGLSRTGLTYRLGDWLTRVSGESDTRLLVMLMLCVACLGAIMSSTGVVAIFIPVALSIAARTGMHPSALLMPLSVAGLISGTMTLIATPPNLIVDAELARSGLAGFGFFSLTPFGIVILAVGIGYMLLARRFLGHGDPDPRSGSNKSFSGLRAFYGVHPRLYGFRVGADSPLAGSTLAAILLSPDRYVGVVGLERHRRLRRTMRTTVDQTKVVPGDVLMIDSYLSEREAEGLGLEHVSESDSFFESHSRQLGMAEVMIAPESSATGKTIRELRFRRSHGLTVHGLRRGGQPTGEEFTALPLRAGDTVLVSGAWVAIERLRRRTHDYLVLELPAEVDEVAPAANQAPFAFLSVAVMVALMVTGLVPNVVAALIACLMLLLFRCIDLRSVYRAIHWPTILLIVGMLPFALALERTGGIDLVVDGLLAVLGDSSPLVLMAGLFTLTAVIGLFVSNTATAVLMAPIAISTALHLGVSPYPFAMIVALASSAAFMTPVSSPVNTLVVEPGRYTFFDFVKVGTPLTIIVMVVSVLLVPVLLPL